MAAQYKSALSRPLGNAQSRNPALGNSPAYGNTTNPNGTQTAARMTLGGKPVTPLPPEQDQFNPAFRLRPSVEPTQSPVAPYAGGDVVGASQAYRDAGLKAYNQNTSALAAPSSGYRIDQALGRVAPWPGGGIASAVNAATGQASNAIRSSFGTMANGQMIPNESLSPAQQAEWNRAMRESTGQQGGGSPQVGFNPNLPQVPRAQFGVMANGQMIPNEPMSPAQQAEWARAARESSATGRQFGGQAMSAMPGIMQPGGSAQQSSAFASMVPGLGAGPSNPMGGIASALMQGFGKAYTAMGSSPAERALSGQMDALTARSLAANPSRTQAPTPIEQFSTAANRLGAQEAARQQNQYNGNVAYANDPNRVTAEDSYRIAIQNAASDPRGLGASGDPTGLSRRFGGNSSLAKRAAGIAGANAAVANKDGVYIQPGGYGSNQEYLGFRKSKEEALAGAKASALKRIPEENAAEHKAAMKAIGDRKRSALAKSVAETGTTPAAIKREQRKIERDINREVKAGRITREEAGKAVTEQMERRFPKTKPQDRSALSVIPANSRGATGDWGDTGAADPQKAKERVQNLAVTDPYVRALGITADTPPAEVMQNLATLDTSEMTFDESAEAANSMYDLMMSQMDAGNWSIPADAAQSNLPQKHLLGIKDVNPRDKVALVRWFEGMLQQIKKEQLQQTAGATGSYPGP